MRRFALLLLLCLASLARADNLLVIANESVPASSLSADDLGDIYLIRKTHWGHGLPVVPVNREASSNTRASFSEQLFGQSPADLSDYWNRLCFEGKRPPLVQTSDLAVIGFVRNVPGAIGYVSSRSQPQGVKILMRLP